MVPVLRRFSRKRTLLLIGVLVLVTLLAAPAAARSLGRWLVVEEAPQQARAIVVLAGHLPFRASEAATTYREGWATEVWITQGRRAQEEAALERLKIDRIEEHDYSRQVLEAQGVPTDAIHILPERNSGTADEVRSVSRRLREAGGGRVIFVTSKFHTRRVKLLWRLLATDQEEAVVRYTSDDPFDPVRWWQKTGSTIAVAREYGAMLNAWLGFPVSSER